MEIDNPKQLAGKIRQTFSPQYIDQLIAELTLLINSRNLETTSDLINKFPYLKGTHPTRKIKRWAVSALKGGKGKDELAKLGYESREVKEGSKINYYFRKLKP